MAVSANRLELLQIADAVAREKSIDRGIVIAAMEDAIQKAARSRYGAETEVRAEINPKTGEMRLSRHMLVVDQVENESSQISVEDAKRRNPAAQVGDTIADSLPPLEYGRIAAQSAKQVIVQKVREAERDRQYQEYKDRIGDIVNGIVKRVEYGNVVVDLGRGEAIVRRDEMLPRETFRNGDRLRAFIYDVRREPRGPQIFLSRTHPQFMAKLFAQEVPEIYDGIVEVKAVARDPGSRAKIAVISRDSSVDPVGACVGMPSCRARRSTSFRGPPIPPTSSSTRWRRRKSPRSCSTRTGSGWKWWCPTSSFRSPSAAAARTCGSPRNSPAGTSTSSPSRKSPSTAKPNSKNAPNCSSMRSTSTKSSVNCSPRKASIQWRNLH
jgi:transcription termination factor NusA